MNKIIDNHKLSKMYIDYQNYDLNSIDDCIKYIDDCEYAYHEKHCYLNDKTDYYDEDSYIKYHFINIPSEMWENEDFMIKLMDLEEKSYGFSMTNLWRSDFLGEPELISLLKIFTNNENIDKYGNFLRKIEDCEELDEIIEKYKDNLIIYFKNKLESDLEITNNKKGVVKI